MKATSVSRVTQGTAPFKGGAGNEVFPPLRATRKRRIARLQAIVAELKVRDLGCAGTAALVECSQSAARLYLAELREAGVICSRTIRQTAGNVDKFAHRLSADEELIERFLAMLGDSMRSDSVCACGGLRDVPATALVRNSLPLPDPLISALFGRS